MFKNLTAYLVIGFLLTFFSTTMVFAGGPDDEGNYYPDNNDQIIEWNITIDSLKLVKDDDTQVPIITSTTSPVNIADPSVAAGNVAGFWTQNVAVSPGTYTGVLLTQGAESSYVGCIQAGDSTWRATSQGTTSYATKAAALAAATTQSFTFEGFDEEDLPFDSPVTVAAGQTYTLKILWDASGTVEADPENNPGEEFPGEHYGVCLLWNPTDNAFAEGRLDEEYVLE